MMKYLLFSLPLLVLAGCSSNANNADYKKNLATAQAVLAAHSTADYDTWSSLHHEDAVIWDANYGSASMTRDEAAVLYASHHEAIDGIDGSDAVWLPGVDTSHIGSGWKCTRVYQLERHSTCNWSGHRFAGLPLLEFQGWKSGR